MNFKKIILCLFLIIALINNGFAGDLQFHGRVSNSLYSYEDTTSHTKIYQFVRFSLESPRMSNFSLNVSLRALSDLNVTLEDNQRFKAYNLNMEFKKLFNRLDLVVGRQFLHPGTVLGGLDGLYTKCRITKKMSLSAYGGVESHFNRSLKLYKFDDSFTAGGLFEWRKLFCSNLQMFYLQKTNTEDMFWQLAGLNLQNSLIPRTNLRIQAHYDLLNSRLHRLLAFARIKLNKKIALSLGYKNQHPQIYANSYFTIFEINPYQQYKLGANYFISKNFFLSGQYQLLQFDTETANRVFLTFNNMNGSIGLVYESGYAGEQLGIVFDYAYSITPKLLASINIDYSRYKTEKIYEFENEIANAVRFSYKFLKRWTADLEYQWLTNRFKESDSRLLNHIHFNW